MTKFTSKGRVAALFAGAASAALTLAFAGQASAQTSSEERIAALEAQLQALQEQIADLKQATATADQDLRDQVSATQTTLSNGRPTIATGDGSQKFAIRTVVQMDAASYDEKTPGTDLNSGTNFRRARLGIEGTFGTNWNYNLTGEFGGSGTESAQLNQAYVEYAGWKPFGLANPLRVRVGAWATPTGLEDGTSNTDSLFLERAAVAELVRNLAGGDGRTGVGFLANGDHWYADAVLTGATVATSGTFDEQLGYLARVAFNPIYSPDYSVHIGANIQGVLQPADTGTTARSIVLQERPELRVDGTRLVATPSLPYDGLTAYGLELGGNYKNLQAAAEAFKIDVDRVGAFDPSFDGWYAHLAYTLTGEAHTWNPQNGGYRGIKPAKPFDPANGGWGAWEIAARYSHLNLNDGEGVAGAATPVGGVRGGEQNITTVGLNWYPNSVFRFLLDYQWINVDRLNSAGAQVGQDVEVVSLRSQFAF